MQHSDVDCNGPYSWDSEDMGSYAPGWIQLNVNDSKTLFQPWQYQSQAKLRSNPVWGSVALYKGGGFVVDLGSDLQNASRYYLFILL